MNMRGFTANRLFKLRKVWFRYIYSFVKYLF